MIPACLKGVCWGGVGKILNSFTVLLQKRSYFYIAYYYYYYYCMSMCTGALQTRLQEVPVDVVLLQGGAAAFGLGGSQPTQSSQPTQPTQPPQPPQPSQLPQPPQPTQAMPVPDSTEESGMPATVEDAQVGCLMQLINDFYFFYFCFKCRAVFKICCDCR